MLITQPNLNALFTGFKTSFNKGFDGAESHYKDVAMVMPSSAKENTYAWLGQFPSIREWIGDRIIRNLSAHGFTLENKRFENTISIPRTDVEDDQYGLFGPMMEEMGRLAKQHPDELTFGLLKQGFTSLCYDGQYFFDPDHPVKTNDAVVSVSNYQAGSAPAWYLLDCSRAIKPMIFQERLSYAFTALTQDGDENVFWRDEYVYGIRARANAGFGLWQLAYASKAPLTFDNFVAARAAMRAMTGDEGRPLGIKPTHLVVPATLEKEGREISKLDMVAQTVGGQTVAVSNGWKDTVELVVSEWL